MGILLFLLTNFLVTMALSAVGYIVMTYAGIDPSAYSGLLILSLIFGFTGSILSLLMSKTMAKRSVGAVVIEKPRTEAEAWLLQVIAGQAQKLKIKMPEVAIYPGREMNAFATGAFKNSALVAVSTGLLERMSRDEVEAVLAHEMSHVSNGDMVTMALLQGVANTFVIFFARVVAQIVSNTLSRDGENSRGIYFLVSSVLQMIFMVLANIVILWFSRRREYYADAGSADLVGAPKMIAALKKLKTPHQEELPSNLEAFGISGAEKDSLFSTHPSLDNRIHALERRSYRV